LLEVLRLRKAPLWIVMMPQKRHAAVALAGAETAGRMLPGRVSFSTKRPFGFLVTLTMIAGLIGIVIRPSPPDAEFSRFFSVQFQQS
jgi:hypothetical protein